jgi:hypothetical protein
MADNIESSKLLASLVVFRELYNKQKDVYGVICDFLSEIIRKEGLYSFNLTQITGLLNSTYDFAIPEAVVKTALRRLKLRKDQKAYYADKLVESDKSDLAEIQNRTSSENNALVDGLFSFIESETGTPLTRSEKTKVTRAFCAFLLDDSNGSDYYEYISGFAIKNKGDERFKRNLNRIREGVILYSGIKFNGDINAVGSWKTSLSIYLDTEILFHYAGYNGKLFKSLVDVFFEYVNEINSKAKKNLVRLFYFSEVRNEIEDFFASAESIVTGKELLSVNKTAMLSIVTGCKTASDVLSKKSDFDLLLRQSGIHESARDDFYSVENREFNIADKNTIEVVSKDLQISPELLTESMKFLNYIRILRGNSIEDSFETIGHILLTGNSTTIKFAMHNELKKERNVPLATTLPWITNRFWFKLNKGFGDGNFPLSFDIITKAQMVLSTMINRSIGDQYAILQAEYKNDKITSDQAKARYVDLRSKTRYPEEIEAKDISPILDDLSDDSLERFIKEQEQAKIESHKQKEEDKKLIEDLGEKVTELRKKNEISESEKQRLLIDKKQIVNSLRDMKGGLDKKAAKDFMVFKVFFAGFVFVLYGGYIFILIKFWGNLAEALVTGLAALPIALTLLLIIFNKEWSWKPRQFLRNRELYFQKRVYTNANFDLSLLEKIEGEIDALDNNKPSA